MFFISFGPKSPKNFCGKMMFQKMKGFGVAANLKKPKNFWQKDPRRLQMVKIKNKIYFRELFSKTSSIKSSSTL